MASSWHLLWKRVQWYVIQTFGTRINLVLCGGRGPEKTSAAESILGRAELPAASGPGQCVKHQGEVCGRRVSLVELPALSGKPLEAVMQQCLRCISLCGPEGVHAFILVLPLGPLTDEDKAELKTVQDTLGSGVHVFTMILFTVDSEPTAPDVNIQELSQSGGGGYFIFNTRNQQQVSELLDYLYEFKTKNVPHSYTTETLVQVQIENVSRLQRKLQETTSYNQQSPSCRRIAVIGKTGSGKSSSGNTILGKRVFETRPSQKSITKVCETEFAEVMGRQVYVVDTPGLFDTTMSGDDVNDEMQRCISLLTPGPHIFLLVLQIGRLTPEERETLQLIKEGFGQKFVKYTIVLFTHGDKLVNDEITIEKYIETYCDDLVKQLISNCRKKYHVFNNCNTERPNQVRELMEKIDDTVKENMDSCYTTEMLLEAKMQNSKNMKIQLREKEEQIKEKDVDIKSLEDEIKEKDDMILKLEKEKLKLEKEKENKMKNKTLN